MKEMSKEKNNMTKIFEDSMKSIKIYKLIIEGNSIENIPNSEIEINERVLSDISEFKKYIKDIHIKGKKKILELNKPSKQYINLISNLIEKILENSGGFHKDLRLLSSCHLLHKILTTKDDYERFDYIEAIDKNIIDLLISKDKYYHILMKL